MPWYRGYMICVGRDALGWFHDIEHDGHFVLFAGEYDDHDTALKGAQDEIDIRIEKGEGHESHG